VSSILSTVLVSLRKINRLFSTLESFKDLKWCPGPELNRHGVSSEGFSYQLQFSLRRYTLSRNLAVCGLDFLFILSKSDVDEGRQVSTLSDRINRLSSGLPSIFEKSNTLRFPRIWPYSQRAFPSRVLKFLSPLCLPISPPGRGGRISCYLMVCQGPCWYWMNENSN